MLSLWLPILLSAVFVFVLSAVIYMALPWHKGDFGKMPDEDKIRAALRPFNVPPGDYLLPACIDGNYQSAEHKAKLDEGPNQIVTVLPKGCASMGPTFVQWFAYLVAVGFFTAYVTIHAVPAQAPYLAVFRIAGAVAFLAHAAALWPQSIWYRRSWSTTVKSTIDGLVYALVTAGTFAWLWPR
jgi:hypothetical protein